MLFFLIISCLSFIIFLHNSLYLKQIQLCISEMRLPSLLFLKDLSVVATFFRMSIKNKSLSSKVMNCSDSCSCNISDMCLLDLPDLALECILEKLPPEGLLSMASVCSSMREMCMGDCLWEKRMKKKWGKVIGPAACLKWQWHVEYKKESRFFSEGKEKGLMSYLVKLWPVSLVRSICNSNGSSSLKRKNYSAIDSVMCWYLALESGNFWLPAQVYNRENGHAGFMLSCYDAELCYDSRTDTFQARYPPHGRKSIAIETGVTWDRVRPAPVDVSPYDLHISDCLNELRPGDHIEIQWRRNKEFPYGWWYGVVGHLDQCGGNENHCQCPESDMITLEFSQYAPGSRWRTTIISRKDHKEEGNEADGFYAGIRKLDGGGEISAWNRLRPAEVLE